MLKKNFKNCESVDKDLAIFRINNCTFSTQMHTHTHTHSIINQYMHSRTYLVVDNSQVSHNEHIRPTYGRTFVLNKLLPSAYTELHDEQTFYH